MQATYTKTYKGKTAGQWLKSATISRMQAGTFEITTPDLPGCVLMQDQDGDLVIDSFAGNAARLICGPRAAEKLQQLHDASEAAYSAA